MSICFVPQELLHCDQCFILRLVRLSGTTLHTAPLHFGFLIPLVLWLCRYTVRVVNLTPARLKFPIAAGNSETTTTPQYHRSEGARLRTWTRALPTKCTPWTMPQGNLSPRRYAYKRTCRRLRKGGDLFSAWNTSSDVPPRDPSAAARSFFFTAHPHRQAPPTITPKTGSGDGCRLGVRNSGNTGPPETRAGHVLPSQ